VTVFFAGQPAVANAQPVTRPLKIIEGHMTIIVDQLTGAYHFTDSGNATHTGLYSATGAGIVNLITGQFLSGAGFVVTANGDTLSWEIGAPNQVVYTGGTGRFSGVAGGFLAIINQVTPLSNNGDGTITLAISYDGTGTITY
jgi:hypothetical protein